MKKLSIIIPVYNEQKTILDLIQIVKNVNLLNGIEKEIIIVDDCSTDGTRSLLEKMEKEHKIIYHDKNRGKGAAIRTALEKTTGDIIIIQDADLEYNPNEYNNLLKPILEGKSSVVYGSRFSAPHIPRYKLFYLGNKLISLTMRLLFRHKVTDIETCFKMFKKDVINNISLKSNRFNIEPEITAKILKAGYTIHETNISYNCRSFAEGKKIRWHDGIHAIISIIRYRFFD